MRRSSAGGEVGQLSKLGTQLLISVRVHFSLKKKDVWA